MLVVNLLGGPGSGKSSMAARIFADLKWQYISCEYASEWAKDRVWEGTEILLGNQLLVFANQYHKLHALNEKVDVVVTDSPLILSAIYGMNESKEFTDLVLQKFNSFNNINFFVKRSKPYVQAGRLQTESKARKIDEQIEEFLNIYSMPRQYVTMSNDSLNLINTIIRQRLCLDAIE